MPSFDLWDDAPASKAKLIVIDECSMVDAELGRDLMSFGVPLLVLGDPAQLPPIQGGGFFTEAEPDAMLTEVHRQAQDDPIVRLSMDIRAGNRLGKAGEYGETQVVRREALDPQRVIDADQVLVGRNATRRTYNMRMRERRGFADALPMAGDKLVCLRNNRRKGLFNGGLWVVKERPSRAGRSSGMRLRPDEELGGRGVKVSVRPECFTGGIEQIDWPQRKRYDEFDYGYVLTVHKAQGSQWDDVVLFDESFRVPGQPRALALYRRHARGEAADGGDVSAHVCRATYRPFRPRESGTQFFCFFSKKDPSLAHGDERRDHFPSTSRTGVSGVSPPRRRAKVSSAALLPFPGDRARRIDVPILRPVAERIAVPRRLRRERRQAELLPDRLRPLHELARRQRERRRRMAQRCVDQDGRLLAARPDFGPCPAERWGAMCTSSIGFER